MKAPKTKKKADGDVQVIRITCEEERRKGAEEVLESSLVEMMLSQ